MADRLDNFKPCPKCGEKPAVYRIHNRKMYEAKCCNIRTVAFAAHGILVRWNEMVEDIIKEKEYEQK